jgi:MFS family permease
MNTYRKSAITVGLLFLIALILNPIATEIFDPILNTPDYLEKAYTGRNLVIIGNLLNFICAIAMIFIPISLFPVARKNNESLASSYIIFRALEGILFIFIAIKSLSFISLSKVYINEATRDASYLQSLGSSIHAEIYWATIIYIIIYALGGVTFYYLLYKSKLVPRFLSIWGLLAVVLLLVGAILGLFSLGIFNRLPLMKAMVYFAPPIAINEFVLALWLIIKGYNSPAMDFDVLKTDNKL